MLRQIRWQIAISVSVVIILTLILGGYLLDQPDTGREQIGTLLSALGILAVLASTLSAHLIANRLKSNARELAENVEDLASGKIEYGLSVAHPSELQYLQDTIRATVPALANQINTLQREQTTLASIIKQMTDGVIIADENNLITLINPAAEAIFNIRAEQVKGKTLAEAIRYHQLLEICEACRQTGREQHISLELPHTNTFIHGVATVFGQVPSGHILLIIQDLTRMRRLETARSDFISNISHELRTPLASIRALAETLRSTALDDPPAARRFLGRMETEVDALTHMVSELLELSRIESGQVPLEMQPICPQTLLRSAKNRLSMQAERAKLNIVLKCQDDLPAVNADVPRLEQVFVNLLHNAIKFSRPGDEINLTADQIDDMIVFSIQDEGLGIPADDLPRIFERFYKTDRARTGGGTGLGLSIARHLVESHGGKIWADSVEGQGSTFFFTIPIVN
jgi:two-component system phosphate regulon sensor histidine kinase PhoR